MSHGYRNQDIVDGSGRFHEEIGESNLAYELPAKFLTIRIDDLVDEHALLDGKVGEMELILADGADDSSADAYTAMAAAYTGSYDHDFSTLDNLERVRRLQKTGVSI